MKIKSTNGFANQFRHSLFFNYALKNSILKNATQYWTITNHNNVSFCKFFKKPCCLNIIENHMMCVHEIEKFDYENEPFSFLAKKYTNEKSFEICKKSFKDFELKDEYKFKIQEFIKENAIENSIGLHLRTTCKTALLKENKNSRFQPKDIQHIIKKIKETDKKVYLATDNKETQDKMINLFGNKIIFYKKIESGEENFEGKYDKSKVKRNTTDLHTIFDFYALQRCSSFIGSNESTFSIMIKWIRNNATDDPISGSL